MAARAKVLSPAGISQRLSSAGYRRHVEGVAGYWVNQRPDGAVEVYHLNAYRQVVDPDLRMLAWGRHLAAAGFTVVVNEDTHLVVTLPATGAADGAPHAVERAA